MGAGRSSAIIFSWVLALFLLLQPITASYLVQRHPDRLQITTTHKVECDRKSQDGDLISVHYTGTLKKGGKKFDSSYDRKEPIAFELGSGHVIAGWDQGLKDMCVDEERKLIIPPELAYGNHRVGPIPAGSTLVFQTKLVAINGKAYPSNEVVAGDQEEEHDQQQNADDEKAHDDETHDANEAEEKEEEDPGDPTPTVPDYDGGKDPAYTTTQPTPDHPQDDQECRLLGPFALFVQAGLGLLAIFSLVWKRWRERPRRPIKIWFFDASKQVVGSGLLHSLNLLMSIISSADFELASKVKEIGSNMVGDDGHRINPCSFYLINIAIDTTIGIPILIVFLRLLHVAFRMTPLARPVESIKSGHYGQPPRVTWWLKQCFIYFIGLVLMKLCVFFIVEVLPWIAWVGDWALRWTEGNEALQIAFVMFVFPLIMNALQYYIIDSFIKERGVADYTQSDSAEPAAGATYHTVSGYDSDRDSLESDEGRKAIVATSSEIGVKEQGTAGDSEQHSSQTLRGPSSGNAGPL